jgi:aminoglycoside phosphotransferase (APT) family kinase protein
MTTKDMSAENEQALVVAWIEKEIGPIRKIARQGRWRPAWFIEAEHDGQAVALYVRGARGGRFPPMPLSYEGKVLTVFAEEGVKVAPVYGFIDTLPALVMGQLPGRPNIATAESDEDRHRLREQLADQMRMIHEIDPARIEALGAPNPSDLREATLGCYRQVEQLYLDGDKLPSPDIEFVRRWVNRNTPVCEEGPAVITVDAGQFMFEGDELTGMVDLELVGIGDRHLDMAALRTRDLIEEIGDLESFYDLYHERGGLELDRDRIAFHYVTFAMLVPLQIAHELAHPELAPMHHEYFGWHARAIEAAMTDIARIADIPLVPYVLPQPTPDRSALLLQSMVSAVEDMPAPDDYAAYRRQDVRLAVKYLGDYATRRAAMEREYINEVEALTGRRPRDAWDGDMQMVEFVQSAGPELDAPIVQLLLRRNQRVNQILRMHSLRRRAGKESE